MLLLMRMGRCVKVPFPVRFLETVSVVSATTLRATSLLMIEDLLSQPRKHGCATLFSTT